MSAFPRNRDLTPEELRSYLPLPNLMERLGLGDRAKKLAFCPFHENLKTPAFSVFQGAKGWRWNCFAGCGSGDEIEFLKRLEDLDYSGALRRWNELVGVRGSCGHVHQPLRGNTSSTQAISSHVRLPEDFWKGTEREIEAVATLRGVAYWAVLEMNRLGVLGFGTVHGFPCWIVTDASQRVAEARRLDGKPFPALGGLGERKTHTLRGSSKSWPVGLCLPEKQHEGFRRFLLLEGSGDLVAGYHFCLKLQTGAGGRFLPIAMLGAGMKISQEAMGLFRGREIRIVPHQDESGAGQNGEAQWRGALERETVGGTFSLAGLRRRDGRPVKDLNDCTDIHPDDQSQLERLLQ
jgi:hypothetical protein